VREKYYLEGNESIELRNVGVGGQGGSGLGGLIGGSDDPLSY